MARLTTVVLETVSLEVSLTVQACYLAGLYWMSGILP
jgi:hypothetical protein